MAKSTNGTTAPTLTPESVQQAITQADLPRFDLGELSWGDSKRLAALGTQFNEEQAKGEAMDLAVIAAILQQFEDIAAPLILSIPRAWLVRRAPESLDFTQPGVLNWLRKDRFMDLVNALASGAGEPADDAANLPKP